MLAKLVKELDNFAGKAGLYKLDPPMKYTKWDFETDEEVEYKTEYVVVSPANVMFSGPETYIFASDENGEVTDWMELAGSFRGGLNRERALNKAGYIVEHVL